MGNLCQSTHKKQIKNISDNIADKIELFAEDMRRELKINKV